MQLLNVARGGTPDPAPARRPRPRGPPARAGSFDARRPRRAPLAPGSLAARACRRRCHATKSRTTTRASTRWARGSWSPAGACSTSSPRRSRCRTDRPRRAVAPRGRSVGARAASLRRWSRAGPHRPRHRRGRAIARRCGRRRRYGAARLCSSVARRARGLSTVHRPRSGKRPRARSTAGRRGRRTVLAAGCGAAASAADLRLAWPPPRRSRCPWRPAARARATSLRARCRCGRTSRRTRCPTTTPRRSSARVRVAYPVQADRVIGLGEPPTLRLQRALGAPGRTSRRAREGARLVALALVPVPARHRRVPAPAPPGALRARRRADLRDVRPRADRLLGGADRAALVRGARGPDGRRPITPELRRMMVEYGEQFWKSGWAPLYGVLGGNPLAAMPSLHFATSVMAAHLLAETGPVAGRDRLDLRPHARASRSSTSASTTSSTCSPGSRWPRASAACARRARRRCARVARGRPGARGAGAPRMRRRAPLDETRGSELARAASRPARTTTDDEEMPRGAHAPALLLGGSSSSSVLVALLLRAAADRGPRRHLAPHRATADPVWLVGRALVLESAVVRRLRRAVPRRVRPRAATRIDWRASYQITMAGLAATRLFAAAGAGGVALTAWALRRSGMERRARRLPDGRLPRPALRRLHGRARSSSASACGPGVFPGDGAVRADRRAGRSSAPALIAIFLAIALHPGRLRAPHRRALAQRRRGARAHARQSASPRPGLGRHRRAHRDRPRAPARAGRCSARSGSGPSNIAVLWACLHAFAASPSIAVLIMASTSGCSATCCRCRAGSAASTAA